jgi:septal ring factor EnvC (AmiA/AmiB activator)
MARRAPRGPDRALTHAPLVLSTRPQRHGRLSAAVLSALALGVGATLAWPHALSLASDDAEPPALRQWRDEAEQRRLALQLAQARAEALERQIDTLNQQLREAREELTFFRQARDGRR